MSDRAIETLLDEERRFPPDPAFAAPGERDRRALRRRAGGVLGRAGARPRHVVRGLPHRVGVGAAVREVVPRGDAERRLQLRRPSRGGRPRRSRRLPLGGRARGRPGDDHVRRAPAARRRDGERPEGARRREGHEGRDLPRDGPGAADRDARVHPARRPAHGRLRRVLGRLALGPRERHGLRGARHAGRGLAPRLDRAAQAHRRRGDGRRAGAPRLPRRPPHGQRGADAGGPRPLAARLRRPGRPGDVPVRADGRGGPAVPDVHVRHDRQAEGHRPHDRRLPRRRGGDAPLRLRPEARDRRLLVRRRHRLDHGAQLHRLRAALQRGHLGGLRGHPRLPRQGALVVDRRALRRHDPLHGADRDPRPHEVGPRARRGARPRHAAPPRLGRRADQPRGVDVVPRAHRRRGAARSSTRGGRPRRG